MKNSGSTLDHKNSITDSSSVSSYCSTSRNHEDTSCLSSEDEGATHPLPTTCKSTEPFTCCSPTIPEEQALSPLAMIEQRMARFNCVMDKPLLTPEPEPMIHHHLAGNFQTINQNEFFLECLVQGQGSSVIHFFDKSSNHSQTIDNHLQVIATQLPTCKFLRIDSAWTHFVAAKLQITQFPTVLAIENKIILDRLSDFNPSEAPITSDELEQWLVRTIPMIQEYLDFR